MNVFTRFSSFYMKCLQTRPILTKSTTASVILGTGDVIAQNIEMRMEDGQSKSYSPYRTLRMAIVGFTVIGFQVHIWFSFLERTFPGNSWTQVAKKIAVDQMFTPYLFATNITATSILQGHTPHEIKEKLSVNLVPLWMKGLMVWPIVNTLGFKYIPIDFRLLWNNCASVCWNSYMSYINHKPHKK